jgi:hypothetical protein
VTRPALCVLLVILAGCGGAERVATATRTPDRATGDRAAIQARVAAYLRHMLAGEGEQACAQLTPGYRRDLDTRAADAGLGDCATVLSGYGEIASAGETKAFLRDAAKPGRVVTPDRKLSTKRTALRRVGTRWLIDELGVSRTG